MKLFLIIALLFTIIQSIDGRSKNQKGKPTEIKKGFHFSVNKFYNPLKYMRMRLDVYSPLNITGQAPVIFFVTGLQGLIPATFYSQFFKRLNDDGNIVIGVSQLNVPIPSLVTHNLQRAINWTVGNIKSEFEKRKKLQMIVPDVQNKMVLMGHSAGGHIVTQYLNKTCLFIKGLILLDPVDGIDPFNIVQIYITHPPNLLPFVTPSLVLGTGYDPVQQMGLFPACAPEFLSNERFYSVMAGPSWFLNFTEYGHGDMINSGPTHFALKAICQSCSGPQCNLKLFRDNLAQSINFFMGALFGNNQQESLTKLSQPQNFLDLDIISKFDTKGYDIQEMGGFCFRRKESNEF